MTTQQQERLQEQKLDHVFRALSDSTRRRILMHVRDGDKTVNDVASQFEISLPAVSKHLSSLEKAGLITRRKQGRERLCHVEPKRFQSAIAWLEFYQGYWSNQLESLKNFVETRHQNSKHRDPQ